MIDQSKFGNLLGTIGVFGGIFYAMSKKEKLGMTAAYAIGFGIGGYLIGNAITKFYE